MSKRPSDKIWHNGTFVDWDDAKIHVMSHTVNYGSTLFEGIRCYNTVNGPAIFRLDAHVQRLYNSCKIYRMDIPFSKEELAEAMAETVRVNNMKECYIRPVVFRGFGEFGVNPFPCPVEVFIAVWAWGKYLGPEALERGVDVCVSSWARMAPNTFPAMAKAGGHYMNSQLIKMEAIKNGYTEGIALDAYGYVSEGSGQNIFLVLDGKVHTPPLFSSILPGITRATVMAISRDLGYTVIEQPIPREMLYLADEVFFSGTAAEITPVRSIDKIEIGSGARGPITKHIQMEFFRIVNGETDDKYGWLTPVYKAEPLSKGRNSKKL